MFSTVKTNRVCCCNVSDIKQDANVESFVRPFCCANPAPSPSNLTRLQQTTTPHRFSPSSPPTGLGGRQAALAQLLDAPRLRRTAELQLLRWARI